ncbi:MAG: FtsH protease activity modulator HflK [Pseudoxanthomonas sp.]
MAWNTPGSGSGGNDKRNPWKPRGNGAGDLLARLRGLFDGDGGGWRWAVVAVALLVLFSSFQLVGEQQRGVVLRFGQFSRIMQPGPNFKWPWPIESVQKVNATRIETFSNTVPVLTRDENIVSVSLNVQYRIADPRLFLFGTRDADEVLKQAAQSAVREQVGRSDLDTVLGARGPLAVSAKERLQASLDAYRTGLVVTELNLPDARPPEEVKPAFDEVNSAQQIKDRLVNEAGAYAARIVPEARGEAARRRTEAEGYKEAVIAKAQGDASRYSQLYAQYKSAPEVTRKRLWLETVQKVLAQNRKVVGGDGRQLIYVPMPAPSGADATAAPAPAATELVMPAVESAATPRESVRPTRPAGREEVQR